MQAEKIVKDFGGVDAVKAELAKIMENRDYAWSAELAGYLVKTDPGDPEASQLLADVRILAKLNTDSGRT